MVPLKLGDLALQSLHKNLLEEAIRAIDLPMQTRRFSTVVVSLDPEGFEALDREAQTFFESSMSKYKNSISGNERIYHFSFNLVPVSQEIIRKYKNESDPEVGTK